MSSKLLLEKVAHLRYIHRGFICSSLKTDTNPLASLLAGSSRDFLVPSQKALRGQTVACVLCVCVCVSCVCVCVLSVCVCVLSVCVCVVLWCGVLRCAAVCCGVLRYAVCVCLCVCVVCVCV